MSDKESADTKSAEEFSFLELARLIQDKEERGVEFQVFIRQLEEEQVVATRRVEVARLVADVCKATRTRKPRRDKGKKRQPKSQDEHNANRVTNASNDERHEEEPQWYDGKGQPQKKNPEPESKEPDEPNLTRN